MLFISHLVHFIECATNNGNRPLQLTQQQRQDRPNRSRNYQAQLESRNVVPITSENTKLLFNSNPILMGDSLKCRLTIVTPDIHQFNKDYTTSIVFLNELGNQIQFNPIAPELFIPDPSYFEFRSKAPEFFNSIIFVAKSRNMNRSDIQSPQYKYKSDENYFVAME
ncbi:hypothetical protein ECANGB1_736 [Enterospora canceri]|uniref:Uncharacterized protein n=1 Tax=Enterospora canceri TaxID=1081671 RepID=A0A1Y1S7H7_9MICR|nr:hypothetical protein ECANGB1_736 [Enterospora canceri]